MDPSYPDPGRPLEDAAAVLAAASITEASASASRHHWGASAARRTKPAATWTHISAAVLESLRDLHYVLSLCGTIQHVSPNSPALLGYGPEDLVGTVLVDHVHEDDAPVYRDELREASSTGRPFRFYCRIRSRVNTVGAGTNADTALFPSGFADQHLTSSPSFSVFEITGRFHEVASPGPIPVGIGITATPPNDDGLFVLMARPYPLAQGTKLDSFLFLKIENERLTAQLAALKAEQQDNENDADSEECDGYQTRQYSMAAPTAAFATTAMRRPSDGFPWFDVQPSNVTLTTGSASSAQESVFSGSGSSMFGPASSSSTNTSASVIVPSLSSPCPRSVAGNNNKPPPALLSRTFSTTAVPGTIAATTNRSSSSNNNKKNNISINNISTNNRSPPKNTPTVMEGDVGIPFIVKALTGGAGFKKRAKQSVDDYVCAWCSATSSPEWRKGPAGPKSLCNACGLRYAKFRRKSGGSGSGGGGSSDGDGRGGGGGGGGGSSTSSSGPKSTTTVGPVVA
ncbi:white collar-2 [Diplodia corticola]|uniref:White collar-2 n=1 Tax=Diplodia corticola TaxID=236234 RepID=A0A1J9R5S7_9PEZI|nr:white collar-2 [Diplodia corticola]OJD35570.1 white collar-2 [Diplodia corticola]